MECPFNRTHSSQGMCETLQCCECLKPRVLYCQRKLKLQEAQYLKDQLVGIVYSCESLLSELFGQETSPEQTDIGSCVFVRANHACADQVETVYYSSGVFDDVCVHCGDPNDIFRGRKRLIFCLFVGAVSMTKANQRSSNASGIRCNQLQRRSRIHTLTLVFFKN